MKKSILKITSSLAALLLMSGGAVAQTYTEVGDAGQAQGSAQASGISQNGIIFGSFNGINDADVFSLTITNTSTISFTTANILTGISGGLGGLDTELFLFTSAGIPVVANDDQDGSTLQSTLPAGNSYFTSLAPGTYYIGVSLSGNDPMNLNSQLVFETNPDTTALRGPASGINPTNWNDFDSSSYGGPIGSYEIDIGQVPEPSTFALYALGLLALALVVSKRRVSSRLRRRALQASVALVAVAVGSAAFAKQDVPANLGNGLDRLVKSHVAIKRAKAKNVRIETYAGALGKRYTTKESAALSNLAITNPKNGKILVRINLDGTIKPNIAKNSLPAAVSSLKITSTDPKYRGVGVMDAYVFVDDVPALAQAKGVRSVILELKPRHAKAAGNAVVNQPVPGQTYPHLGTYLDQGVLQHRVEGIDKYYNADAPVDYEGSGLSIACISNSFASNTTHPASLDVTNNDLPGNASNPVGNTTPVFVLIDDTGSQGDDEGRGMCEIVYHMAPKARVGFGTADTGEAGFANVIRGLAGINSDDFPNASSDGFAADVVCDDVGYYDEPFFQDGIIGAGVNDVAAIGVSYFSSAANDIGINGYDSQTRWVPNGQGALAGTNINLTGVPPALYAGGFHNFNPNPGQQDIAQTVNVKSSSSEPPTVMQWNDPYDQNTVPNYTATLLNTNGNFTTTPLFFTVNATITQGTLYEVKETATQGSTFDGIVTVYESDGTTVIAGPQDSGTDETVRFFAPINDTGFVIKIDHYGPTMGTFNLLVRSANGFVNPISTSLSLLVFRVDTGAYIASSSLTTDAFATNEPIQLGSTLSPSGQTQVQYVIARSTVPSNPAFPTHVRYSIPGNGAAGLGPAEYFTYNTVTTSGHAMAEGCNGTAAYSAFRPSIPEYYTSPGPVTIYYDGNGNFLNPPQIRLQPGVAALDAGNISANEGAAGLGSDSSSDYDTVANFSGTSAAAPHAAACALLALEGHGGHRSITPAAMKDLLHRTAYLHDLDPNSSTGSARANGNKVTLSFTSDNESNNGTGGNDPNSLSIAYNGPSNITSIVFNKEADAAHGGAVTAGNNGINDPPPATGGPYFTNTFAGLVFPATNSTFAVGNQSVGLTSSDVNATLSNPAPAPSSGQNWTLALNFPNGNFTGGKVLKFKIQRLIQHSSVLPNGTTSANYSGDLFGGGVQIPEGTVTTNGMSFEATFADGSVADGFMVNRIGAGYSKLDGYGFINAEAAATTPLQ